MHIRPRRNRRSAALRDLVQETSLSLNDFIYPMFLIEGQSKAIEITSMPGIYRYTLDLLLDEIGRCRDLGLRAFCLFPAIADEKKDRFATESWNPEGLYIQAIRAIKERYPDVLVMTDVAMDPYSSDGHDGFVDQGEIINDTTLEFLGRMTLAQARAGADLIGPSDMMDGRVGYLRKLLEENNFPNVGILSYTAKYASGFYGPFRDALDSAPKLGDKKTYQMNPANVREALIEAKLDTEEGADILMVKPALAYLDVIKTLRDNSSLPIAAYNVSGEYAMVKAAARLGWLDGEKVMLESLLSIKRAGTDIILSYFAKEVAELWKKK